MLTPLLSRINTKPIKNILQTYNLLRILATLLSLATPCSDPLSIPIDQKFNIDTVPS